jgi:hypothetical protein
MIINSARKRTAGGLTVQSRQKVTLLPRWAEPSHIDSGRWRNGLRHEHRNAMAFMVGLGTAAVRG